MNDGKVESPELRVESQKNGSQLSTLNSPHLSPNQRAWLRFRRHKPAMICSFFLLTLLLIIFLWPVFSAYKPDTVSDAQFQTPNFKHWFGTDIHGRDLLIRLFFGA